MLKSSKAPKAPKAPKAGSDAEVENKDPRFKSQPVREAPAPEVVEDTPPSYINVLDVRESAYKGKAGEEYKGLGIEDTDEGRARIAHLLKRGAVRKK